MTPTKVAILGGGPAGIAAAFHLTATPELRERFDVTVHTLGWRLGGKCASGRSGPEQRIQEHGLHVWFGFYRNAFALMDSCWAELGLDPAAERDRSFLGCDTIVLYEPGEGGWRAREFELPRLPQRDFDFSRAVADTVGWLQRLWHDEPDLDDEHMAGAGRIARAEADGGGFAADLRRALGDVGDYARGVLEDVNELGDNVAFVLETLDLCTTVVRGLAADGALPPRPLDALNDEDLRAWLRRHGAKPQTVEHSPILRALYDLVFAYRHGDKEHPDLAAGKAIQALLRIAFTYEGAVLHKMRSGMGDVVFTPLYHALSRRGVRFEFFSRVQNLVPDGTAVAAVEVLHQVRTRTGAPYDPLPDSATRWPAEPHWDQLDADAATGALDLERVDPPGARTERLERGRDFDVVVAAIPPVSLRAAASGLCALDPPLRAQLERTGTVATQGVQLWLRRSASDLGWTHGNAIAAAMPAGLDTYSTMDQLTAAEGEPEDGPIQHVAYYCAAFPERDGETQAQADARALAAARDLLRNDALQFWPRFAADALQAQYARANISGSERYTLTLAGTVAHRLAAHESGFTNLFLAGDWTRNGLDGGAVEGAVTSGLQAARAIRGEDPEATPGMTGWLERDGFRRR